MSATGPSPNSPGWFLELVPNLPLAAIERRVRAGEQENPNYVSIAGTISALDRVVRTHGSGSPPVQWQPAARELVDHVEGFLADCTRHRVAAEEARELVRAMQMALYRAAQEKMRRRLLRRERRRQRRVAAAAALASGRAVEGKLEDGRERE